MKTTGVTIKLTRSKSEEIFLTALCDALGSGYMSGYGLRLDFNEKEYETAKNNWKKIHQETDCCFEDVLMQILKDGGKLTFTDLECDGEYTKSISISDVYERVEKTPINHLFDAINESGDATTADVILQTVFYEDVIFG